MSYFLTRRVAKAEDGLDDLKLSVNTTNAIVSVINGNIATINTDVGTLKGNITSLNTATNSLQGSITTINSTLNTGVVKSISSQSTGLTISNNGVGGYSLTLASSLRVLNQLATVEGFGQAPNAIYDPIKGLYFPDYFTDNAWRVDIPCDFDNFEYSITLDIQTKTNPVNTHLRWSWDGDFWQSGNYQYRQNYLDFDGVSSLVSGDNLNNNLVYLRSYSQLQHHLKMNLRQVKHDNSYYPRICLQCDCVQTSLNPSGTAHQRPLYTSRSFNQYSSSSNSSFTGTKTIHFYIDTLNSSTTNNYASNNTAWVRVVKIPI